MPFTVETGFEVGVEVRECVLLVTDKGVDVFLEARLEGGKIREVEGMVDFADFVDGIAFQLFESDFGVISGRNQDAIFEEGVIHRPVQADEPIVDVGDVYLLQVMPGDHELECSAGGLKDGIRLAMDVDEFGVREKLKQ